jgi:hypothetical protein
MLTKRSIVGSVPKIAFFDVAFSTSDIVVMNAFLVLSYFHREPRFSFHETALVIRCPGTNIGGTIRELPWGLHPIGWKMKAE